MLPGVAECCPSVTLEVYHRRIGRISGKPRNSLSVDVAPWGKTAHIYQSPQLYRVTCPLMVLPRLRTLLVPAIAVSALAAGVPAAASAPSLVPRTLVTADTSADLGVDTQAIMKTAVPAALTAYIKAKGGHAAVMAVDRATGATVSINADRTFQTASIVKFDILATRLLQAQRAGHSLSSGQRSLAFRMITQSDNNAASALYAADGGAGGVRAANKTFGLTETHPASSWGRTRTTAADQIRLLGAVFKTGGALSAANQKYMLSLMSKVEPDQAWGITAAATSAATGVYVKNGWVEMDAYGHMQGDNSIGRIVEPGHDWLIATMSNYNRSDKAGEKILGALALLAVSGLRAQTAS